MERCRTIVIQCIKCKVYVNVHVWYNVFTFKVAEHVLSKVKAEPEEALQDGNIILNATSEFCRTLGDIPTYGQSGNREEDQEELVVGLFIYTYIMSMYCTDVKYEGESVNTLTILYTVNQCLYM